MSLTSFTLNVTGFFSQFKNHTCTLLLPYRSGKTNLTDEQLQGQLHKVHKWTATTTHKIHRWTATKNYTLVCQVNYKLSKEQLQKLHTHLQGKLQYFTFLLLGPPTGGLSLLVPWNSQVNNSYKNYTVNYTLYCMWSNCLGSTTIYMNRNLMMVYLVQWDFLVFPG